MMVGLMAAFALSLSAGLVQAQKYTLKLPTVVSYELNLPALIAYAEGFFGEEGIKVEDFILGSGGTLRTLLITKDVDFALLAFPHIPIARQKGALFKAVLQTHEREIFSLVVRMGLKGKVNKITDLKGMTIGFTRPGAGAWAWATGFVKGSGMDPDKDVKMIAIGGNPAVIYTSLKSGKVDAYPTWEPTTTRVLEDGIAYPLVNIIDAAQHRKWLGGDNALSLALVTREDVIKDKPDLVQRMVNAHKKGLKFIGSHSAGEVVDAVMGNPKTAQQFKGLDRAMAVKVISRIKGGFGDGRLSRSGFEAELKIGKRYGWVKKPMSFTDFADPSFAGEKP